MLQNDFLEKFLSKTFHFHIESFKIKEENPSYNAKRKLDMILNQHWHNYINL